MSHPTYLMSRMQREDSHTLAGYRAQGGYKAIEKILEDPISPQSVIEVVKDSGLRGRGGGVRWPSGRAAWRT